MMPNFTVSSRTSLCLPELTGYSRASLGSLVEDGGVAVRAGADGGVHGAGDPGAPDRSRAGELLPRRAVRPADRGGDADGVGGRTGAGIAGLQDGLDFGF